jgi:hypothetical protein
MRQGSCLRGIALLAAFTAAAWTFGACSGCGSEDVFNFDGLSDGWDLVDGLETDGSDWLWPDGDAPDGPSDVVRDPDVEMVCMPGDSECLDPQTRRYCNDDGTGYETETCGEGRVCMDGVCIIRLCEPGEHYCADSTSWQVCNADGTGYDPGGDCGPGETCLDGECYTACGLAEALRSSIGCLYYAVDTNPIHSWIPGDYAVALSNTHETTAANVVVERKDGGVWTNVGSYTVNPLQLQTVVLAHRYVDGSAIYAGGAYRITSDLPIIAYQFNPLDGSSSYLSDASLLLPRSGMDLYHIVSHWPQGPADTGTAGGHPAHIQIAATASTNVTVTSTITTQAGSGVPALTPGVPQSFVLEEGDYLQLTVATLMDSFTGTYIESDQPVAVFASNDCANVPASLTYCCCEHLEEQLFGLQTWGRSYVASRVTMRGSEPAVWHILGSVDGTSISFDYNGEVTGLTPTATVNRGQRLELQVGGSAANPGDFFISADQPIHVTQYMVGAFMVSSGGSNGDPSMVQAVPVDQYLNRYVVLVPTTWNNDYFVITRHTGANVTIDGAAASAAWTVVGTTPFEVGRVSVSDGVHVVEGDQPFGIIVVGFDDYDSYAYPGGLNLQIINPV